MQILGLVNYRADATGVIFACTIVSINYALHVFNRLRKCPHLICYRLMSVFVFSTPLFASLLGYDLTTNGRESTGAAALDVC